eukprot:jgi/Hompol1/2398/HPOL_005983-RA
MAGHHAHPASTPHNFVPPVIKGRNFTRVYGAVAVFFLAFRCYYEGGHHFLGHHSWTDPKVIAYLEKVDRRFGSSLATDNMHHH